MIKPLIHDPMLLACPSMEATPADIEDIRNLTDTLCAHRDTCVGMACNMIGVRKRIIAFAEDGFRISIMLNPTIVTKAEPYTTEEGCLSLLGGPRKCTRYQKISVRYQTANGVWMTQSYTGFTAEIIQHEIDHCNGVLI